MDIEVRVNRKSRISIYSTDRCFEIFFFLFLFRFYYRYNGETFVTLFIVLYLTVLQYPPILNIVKTSFHWLRATAVLLLYAVQIKTVDLMRRRVSDVQNYEYNTFFHPLF